MKAYAIRPASSNSMAEKVEKNREAEADDRERGREKDWIRPSLCYDGLRSSANVAKPKHYEIRPQKSQIINIQECVGSKRAGKNERKRLRLQKM